MLVVTSRKGYSTTNLPALTNFCSCANFSTNFHAHFLNVFSSTPAMVANTSSRLYVLNNSNAHIRYRGDNLSSDRRSLSSSIICCHNKWHFSDEIPKKATKLRPPPCTRLPRISSPIIRKFDGDEHNGTIVFITSRE